jgi:hypothetical protein
MKNKSNQIKDNNESSSPLRDINQVIIDWAIGRLPKKENFKIIHNRKQDTKTNNSRNAKSDAVFIGWQETSSGDAFPLYNITAENHPLYHSTVSDQTLRNQNLKIPQTPRLQKTHEKF